MESKINSASVAIWSVYCPHNNVIICDDALQDSLSQVRLIFGDFNAHHTILLQVKLKLVNDSDLVMNDGGPTRVDNNAGTLGFIDLSGLFNSSS